MVMILLIVFLLMRNMVNDNKIYIKYVIADTECEYELLIEMGDIL